MLATAPVHTTGVNIDSVVTIVASLTVIMSAVFTLIAKYIANRITGAINVFRIDVISKMEERLAALEGWRAIMDAVKDRKEK